MMTTESKRKGMFPAFALLGAAFLLGIVLQHIFTAVELLEEGRVRVYSVSLGLLAFIWMVVAGWNRKLRRFFTSNRFAVPVVITLTFFSIVGTLVLQGESGKVLQAAYGSALGFFRALFLDDIFHSFGFAVLMGLGAGGLALVVSRKRKLTARYIGSLGAHIGLLLVLAGAALGSVWGVKGRLNMHKGQSSDRFFVQRADGRVSELPLGFTLRLDDFRLLHYEPEYRLMVFAVDGKKEKRIASVDPVQKDIKELRKYGVELLDYWPDHERETIVEPVTGEAAKAPGTVAALKLEGQAWIFDPGGPDGGRLKNPPIAFFWDAARAEKFVSSLGATASPHVIVIGDEKIAVEVGRSYPIPGADHSIKVLRAFTDFVMDSATRQPANRSAKPNNPAVEVVVLDAAEKQLSRSWLFSKHPDFHHGASDAPTAKLRYLYLGGSRSRDLQAVAVGESAELWLLEKGAVKSKGKIEAGAKLHPSVRRSYKDISRSDRASNPVVRVRVKQAAEPLFLRPKQPIGLSEGLVLVLAHKGGETVRDYLSVLSVLEEGQLVQTKTIEVNDPLEYRGYAIYQADYRPEDPTFSGFQIVRDPGLWIVYLGFLVNFLGVTWAVFGPPVVKRRKAARKSEEVRS
jgi:hypothetical protein